MQSDNLIKITIGAVISVVLFASLFMPIVSEAMVETGEPIEYTNPSLDGSYKLLGVNDNLTLNLSKNSDTNLWDIEINGDVYSTTASQNLTLLYSDALSVTKNAAGTTITIAYDGTESINSADKTITFNNGVVTYSIPSQSYEWTGSYSWVYVLDNNGTWINANGSNAQYVKTINDLIASGSYTTGENDCYYSIKNGVLSITGDFTYSLDYTLTLVDGTSDIYQLSDLTITVGDETFTPFRVLVPEEVNGHQTSGTIYNLLSILPILLIAGLLLGIVTVAIRARLS